jgi:hypothetical protein
VNTTYNTNEISTNSGGLARYITHLLTNGDDAAQQLGHELAAMVTHEDVCTEPVPEFITFRQSSLGSTTVAECDACDWVCATWACSCDLIHDCPQDGIELVPACADGHASVFVMLETSTTCTNGAYTQAAPLTTDKARRLAAELLCAADAADEMAQRNA